MSTELWLYRADDKQLKPVRVLCPRGRYPERDAEGHQVFVNSHFDTEQEAWQRLLDNAEAGVSLAGGRVKEARQRVLDANQYAAEMAVEFQTVRDQYRDFVRAQEDADETPQDVVGEECDE
jgi:hypothetical protein